ncbi:uncharacterized protein LOC134541744 isoform X2 [Bacillus rossius redtenbacheri]|uniref:uncharacterized protein LOC134541744 isoform X2 n=1 Tax=Bacillus rossius redtenbacheri TaxID=93214 RepID=UPI002FDD8BCC
MPQCAVATCRNSHRKTKGRRVRYHRFPAEAGVRRRWVEACGRLNGATAAFNTATARVCSLHFSAASYERDVEHELLGLPPRSRLKRGAVPDRGVPSPAPALVARKKQPRRRAGARRRSLEPAEQGADVTGWGGGMDVLLALGLTPAAGLQDGGAHGLNRMHVMEEESGKAPPAPEDLGAAEHAAPKRCRESPPPAAAAPAADKENTAPPPAAAAAADQPPAEDAKGDSDQITATGLKQEGAAVSGGSDPPGQPEPKTSEPEPKPSEPERAGSPPPPPPSPPPSPPPDDADDRSSGKRASSDSDSDAPKRARLSAAELEERERAVSEYVEGAAGASLDELQRCAAKLQQEISALEAMARAKEHEWNSILRLRKVKEEMLLRLQRKRQVMLIMMGGRPGEAVDWEALCGEWGRPHETALNPVNLSKTAGRPGRAQQALKAGQHVMMVPVVSSSPQAKDRRGQRPILPKPPAAAGGNGQNPVIGEGRQGTILDVRSIIADYRSRHPEMVPRRGRRLKSSLSPTPGQQPSESLVSSSSRVGGCSSGGVFSMASLALGSGSQMRAGPADLGELGFLDASSRHDASSRPSSADSSRSEAPPGGFSFKDVLVQFAKLSQAEQGQLAKPAPPPYPEVTLHPVQHSPPQQSSLLHGILTKSAQRPAPEKPAAFSPTLARLLTAPERLPGGGAASAFHGVGHVSINDLLSSSKGRSEVTITPVTTHPPAKTKEEVVLLEEDEQEDSADRLVIDESGEAEGRGRAADDAAGDEVPECQGCHRRAAQFVCAGCGNQWYCSRDCQVSAWDEHSEVCSG